MCLDPSRLGNQVYRECLILVRGGWSNHPASRMWQGHFHALCQYSLYCLEELTRRGKHYPHHIRTFTDLQNQFEDNGLPPWFGDYNFHSSHRAALLFKKPEWYGAFGWDEKPEINYVWPV